MTRPNIEEIRARADAATPGPWANDWETVADSQTDEETIVSSPSGMVVGLSYYNGLHAGCRREDAAFIAAARADVPALCSRAEELEAALEQIDGEWDASPAVRRIARAALEGR